MIRSLNVTVKICALLVLVIAGALLSGPAGFGPEPQSAEAALLTEAKKLVASDAEDGDEFGFRVAVSGDTAIVGADNEGGNGEGAAYIYQRDEGGSNNWGQVTKLTASDISSWGLFGVSVAISGDIAVVGAEGADSSASGPFSSGAAYVFRRDEGGTDNWGEIKKLTASDADAGDSFGLGLAISGDTLVVGAPLGRAFYVFQRDQGGQDNWGEVRRRGSSVGRGQSIGISGDYLVVGEPGRSTSIGGATVYHRNDGGMDNWGRVATLFASDGEAGNNFGRHVSISGDALIVTAKNEGSLGPFAGAAYVFHQDEGGVDNWGEITKLTASDGQAFDAFGSGVAISGDIAVVGAEEENSAGSLAGAAYVFERDEGGADNWGETDKLIASDAQPEAFLGSGAALDGNTAVIAAIHDIERGAAYIFDLGPLDSDGDGVPDTSDNCLDTVSGAAVDANGCSDAQVDADDDGVCDPGAPSGGPSGCTGSDACPGTLAGEAVDANGCTPAEATENLLDDIDNLGLPNGVANSLAASLNQATANLNDGNPNNDGAVCGMLTAFIINVDAKEQNGQLTATEAEELREAAETIKAALGC